MVEPRARSLLVVLALVVGLAAFLWLRQDTGEAATSNAPLTAAEPTATIRHAETPTLDAPPNTPARAEADSGTAAAREGGGTVLRVTVVDSKKEPLAGARVTATIGDERTERTTDEAGRCDVPLPASAGDVHLFARKHGYFHRKAFYRPLSELTLTLPGLATLSGTVLAGDTLRPVPETVVTYHHGRCKTCEPVVVGADGSGRFVLPHVPLADEFRISLRAPGYGSLHEDILIRGPEPRGDRDFHLERTTRVWGVVVDALSRQPVADAKFTYSGREVAADGSFVSDAVLAARRYDFDLVAPGYCRSKGSVAVVEGETVEVRLLPAAYWRGRVTDPDGEPLADASLRFDHDHARDARLGLRQTRADELLEVGIPVDWRIEEPEDRSATDERGAFRSPELAPWVPYKIRVRCPGYVSRSIEAPPLGAPGSEQALDITLERPPDKSDRATWRGVLRLNGEPIGGALKWSGGGQSGWKQANEDGRFEMRVPPGTVTVRPFPEDRGRRGDFTTLFEEQQIEVRIVEGEQERDIELELEMKPISGRIVFADGSPSVGRSVRAGSGSPIYFWCSAKTDDAGEFELVVPTADGAMYDVGLTYGRGEVGIPRVAPGTSGLELVLPELGKLRVRVLDGDTSRVLHRAEVFSKWSDERNFVQIFGWYHAKADVAGWFEMDHASGVVDLLARGGQGDAVVLASANVRAGAICEVELAVSERTRSFVLAPETGHPTDDSTIVLAPVEHYETVLAWLAEGGQFRHADRHSFPVARVVAREVDFGEATEVDVSGLADGVYRCFAYPDGVVVAPAEIVVGPGQDAPVVLSWTRRN